MCTVVVRVPEDADGPVHLLAIRDEDPARPWRPLGRWWPQHPAVIGVQDQLAGGAWLAAEGSRLAVLLNREGAPPLPPEQITSRGAVVLDAVGGHRPLGALSSRGFNLVTVEGAEVTITVWDGKELSHRTLPPGTHMIAHDEADDPATARIKTWLPRFARTQLPDSDEWWTPWTAVLARSAVIKPTDDRAIVRDNRPWGYPTQSLLACVARVNGHGSEVHYAQLEHAGEWNPLRFAAAIAT
ncbi:MAG: NRDE family protein [Microbacterium sp.]